eukprot:SAG22_NODE_487_length_9870_cov_13.118821_15_plen_120_part_00
MRIGGLGFGQPVGKGLSFISDLEAVATAVAAAVADTGATDPYTVLHSGEAIPSPAAMPTPAGATTKAPAPPISGGGKAVLLGSNGMMGPPGATDSAIRATRISHQHARSRVVIRCLSVL